MVRLQDIKIIDDETSNADIMRNIIKSKNQEDAFQILDVGDIVSRHTLWLRKLPRVVPYFAVKCNPDPTVIEILAKLGACFDCASKGEIIQVMERGVSGDRIIYANPIKATSHIEFARKVGVDRMTVDSEMELQKIKNSFPDARIVIRIRCDAAICDGAYLGLKFGCDPDQEAIKLIHATKDLGLKLHGFSFHVGSPCGEMLAYRRGIIICNRLIKIAKSIGCTDIQLIDIGGGIPGERVFNINEFAGIVNETLKDVDSSIKIISEPGRYYVTTAFSLATLVLGKKSIVEDDKIRHMYYVNDGTYGSFIEELLKLKARQPVSLIYPTGNEKYLSTVWGPTCDSFDCILQDVLLPEFYVGEWLMWEEMGAYGLALATTFNGFMPSVVYPFIRRSTWKALNNMKVNGFDKSITGNGQNGYHKKCIGNI